ncbi:MAG TPA: type II toxin-antitoxin system VapC family toxin [Pyrinomonadaceae bacterium]|nr:type II toxin-antitoxin system VapC family toxin [Pyrinomonadaceae bacterium]
MRYVVDASVSVKWYVPENYEQEAERLLNGAHDLHAPELILPEFSNIIWKKTRGGELTTRQGRSIVAAYTKTGLTLHPHKNFINAAYFGAEQTKQTVYDWTYLALAIALNCEFVTADERFYKALETTKLKQHLQWIGDI